MGRLKSLFMVTRPPLTIGALLGSLALLKWSGNLCFPVKALLIALVITAGSCFFNTLNEYKDREVDSINKPWKPIPSGNVSLRVARSIIIAAGILTVGSLYILSLVYGAEYLAFAGIGMACSYVYDCVRKDILGNICLMGAYGMIALMSLWPKYLLFVLVFAIFTVAFNLMVQYQDMEAEKTAEVATAPQQLGKYGSIIVSVSLATFVLVATLYLYFTTYFAPLLVFASIPLLLYVSNVAVYKGKLDVIEWTNRRLSRLVLLVFFVVVLLV